MGLCKNRVSLRAKSPFGRFFLGLAFSFLFYSNGVHGKPEEGLFRASELPTAARLQKMSAVLDATVYLDAGPSRGSGFIVSNSGYVLTAMHVVRDLPEVRAVIQKTISPNGEVLHGPETVNERWITRSFEQPIVLHNLTIPEMGTGAKIELLALGRWNHTYLKNAVTSEVLEVLRHTYEDYALLRVTNRHNSVWPCIPTAEKDPQDGDAIWSFGLPGEAWRQNGYSSNGFNKFVAYGKVAASEYKQRGYESDLRLILGDQDLMKGMSGGPTVNAEGEAVGINIWISGSQANVKDIDGTISKSYIKDSAVAVSVGAVKRDLAKIVGTRLVEEAFDCRDDLKGREEATYARAMLKPGAAQKVRAMYKRVSAGALDRYTQYMAATVTASVLRELLLSRAELFADLDGDGRDGFVLGLSPKTLEAFVAIAQKIRNDSDTWIPDQAEWEHLLRKNFKAALDSYLENDLYANLSSVPLGLDTMSVASRREFLRSVYSKTLVGIGFRALSQAVGDVRMANLKEGEAPAPFQLQIPSDVAKSMHREFLKALPEDFLNVMSLSQAIEI